MQTQQLKNLTVYILKLHNPYCLIIELAGLMGVWVGISTTWCIYIIRRCSDSIHHKAPPWLDQSIWSNHTKKLSNAYIGTSYDVELLVTLVGWETTGWRWCPFRRHNKSSSISIVIWFIVYITKILYVILSYKICYNSTFHSFKKIC